MIKPLILTSVLLGTASIPFAVAAPVPYEVTNPAHPEQRTLIVIPEGLVPAGWSWEALAKKKHRETAQDRLFLTVTYLREGIAKMTKVTPEVVTSTHLSKGIILTTLEAAPPEIRDDAEVRKALALKGESEYDANEAFFIRTEKERTLIVANQPDGLAAGVATLLESVDYEVLGMGPNWIHIPDFQKRPLIFNLETHDRPGFYIRFPWPTSGQDRGVGTIAHVQLSDPADELVQESYRRWQVGARLLGTSMPRIRGGHALGARHRYVVKAMRDRNKTEGFLFEKVIIGNDADRPPADPSNAGVFWINQGDQPEAECFLSDGKEWIKRNLRNGKAGASLDLTSELTREVLLELFKTAAEAAFANAPDEKFHYSTDPEDGSPQFAQIKDLVKNPDWYPTYLKEIGRPFGPYLLHGFKGINQPVEKWDANSPADIVYAFNNWLLWEYDRYIDSLPPEQQVTATGKSKKGLVTLNLLSYNYHDVPPHFNLDPRIRIKIAGFPKNRGRGEWANLRSAADMAEAYRLLLPKSPSVDYQIWSQAYFHDTSSSTIKGSLLAPQIARQLRRDYDAGFRGIEIETDFNFGKFGLQYYLTSKMLWNPLLSPEELLKISDRWFERSFGSAAPEMKAYYEYMAPKEAQVNSPNTWGKAVRMIDVAYKKAEQAGDEAAMKRINDVKQFWYFYYLVESGQAKKDSPALQEFLWKGQMSYMTAMVMVSKRFFDNNYRVHEIVGEPLINGPAHYTPEETEAWWNKVVAFWPTQEVTHFADTTLIDGTKGSEVDLNDLVKVSDFANDTKTGNVIAYNFRPFHLLKKHDLWFYSQSEREGDEIGFKMAWPAVVKDARASGPLKIAYGISRWDPERKEWQAEVDLTQAEAASAPMTRDDGTVWHVAEARYATPAKGTYRIEVGAGARRTQLSSLDYDLQQQDARGVGGQTYSTPLMISRTTPITWFFYIPKGTKELHFETATQGKVVLTLNRGLPRKDWTPGRVLQINKWGVHRIPLKEGEDGTVASLEAAALPYLYSVPMLFAKTPTALLVPRAVAKADGLAHD